MDGWIEYLQTIGPFTAPLCMFMSIGGYAVIKWLLKQQKVLLVELKAARDDATNLREKRVIDREEAAKEYMEHGEAMRTAIREWTQVADNVLKTATARTQ